MHLFDLCVCVCIRRNKIQFRLYYQYKVHIIFMPAGNSELEWFFAIVVVVVVVDISMWKKFQFFAFWSLQSFFSVLVFFFVFSFSVSFLIKTFSSVYLFVQFQVNIYYRKRKKNHCFPWIDPSTTMTMTIVINRTKKKDVSIKPVTKKNLMFWFDDENRIWMMNFFFILFKICSKNPLHPYLFKNDWNWNCVQTFQFFMSYNEKKDKIIISLEFACYDDDDENAFTFWERKKNHLSLLLILAMDCCC